ncbi:MAG: hypothetical protein DHS20C15_24340 [Planctomycetota bacterium]|nr:MAG: hypothetical protein DHS20C15_24340 [Planctomycetota bacterium]
MSDFAKQQCHSTGDTLLSYYTLADSLAQRHSGLSGEQLAQRMERDLKAALLLHDGVVMRATSALRSTHTAQLLLGNRDLLRSGLVRPEVREGEPPLAEQIRGYRFAPGLTWRDRVPLAEALDDAARPFSVDAPVLSDARSNHLIRRLFALMLSTDANRRVLKDSVRWDDMGAFFEMMFTNPPVERLQFMPHLRALFRSRREAERFYIATYVSCGAHYLRANPVWAGPVRPSHGSSLWALTSVSDIDRVLPAARLADRFDLRPFVEARAAVKRSREAAGGALGVLGAMGVPLPDLDALSLEAVLELREGDAAKRVRLGLARLLRDPEPKESSTLNAISALRDGEALALGHARKVKRVRSIVLSILGFVPYIGVVGSGASLVEAGLDSDSGLAASQKAPLHVLSMSIQRRALAERRKLLKD